MSTKKQKEALRTIEEKIDAAKALIKEAKDVADAAGVSFVMDISGVQTYEPGTQTDGFESSDEAWDDSGCTI